MERNGIRLAVFTSWLTELLGIDPLDGALILAKVALSFCLCGRYRMGSISKMGLFASASSSLRESVRVETRFVDEPVKVSVPSTNIGKSKKITRTSTPRRRSQRSQATFLVLQALLRGLAPTSTIPLLL